MPVIVLRSWVLSLLVPSESFKRAPVKSRRRRPMHRDATFGALQSTLRLIMKIIPYLHCHHRYHLGTSWGIPRVQLFTAARLEPRGLVTHFRTQPRLSDDRSVVIPRAAVESHRLDRLVRKSYQRFTKARSRQSRALLMAVSNRCSACCFSC